MSASPLSQAIELIKAEKKAEAQKLLEPLLEAEPRNVTAWLWYVETWPAPGQKIQALELCLQYNPDNALVKRALATLQAQQPAAPSASISEPQPQTPAPAGEPAHSPTPQPGPSGHSRRLGLGLWPVIGLLALLASCLIAIWVTLLPKPNRNALAIGQQARAADLDIAIQLPAELDFKSKAEVLESRKAAVLRYPHLISGDYEPSDAVFGQIEDGRPWWGITGHFYLGPGERSIEGPAEEARFLLNPYLLVAAEFDGLFYSWDTRRITEGDLRRPDFPFHCEASQLRWSPREARAEVTYNVSQCLARTNPWTTQPLGLANAYFSLIAYNARDMNLNYIYVSYPDSRNVSKLDAPTSAYANPQYLHRGGSCGYPGGCNNMSPDTPEISWINITELPAQAVVWLWRQRPWSVKQSPDMVFVIHFK